MAYPSISLIWCSILPLTFVGGITFATDNCRELFISSSQNFLPIFQNPVKISQDTDPNTVISTIDPDLLLKNKTKIEDPSSGDIVGMNLLDSFYYFDSKLLSRIDLSKQWLHNLNYDSTFLHTRPVQFKDDIRMEFIELNFAFQNIIMSRHPRWHPISATQAVDLPSQLLGRTVEGLFLDIFNLKIVWFNGIVFRTFSLAEPNHSSESPAIYLEVQTKDSNITINLAKAVASESLFVLDTIHADAK